MTDDNSNITDINSHTPQNNAPSNKVPLNPAWFAHSYGGDINDISLCDSLDKLSRRLRGIGGLMVYAEQGFNELSGSEIVVEIGALIEDLGEELSHLSNLYHNNKRK